jgi:hypothetical protein
MIARRTLLLIFFSALLFACAAQPEIQPSFDPQTLRFSGERAFEIEGDFVTSFPYRHSGAIGNLHSARWLLEEVGALGWDCSMDRWTVILYSRPVVLQNVICKLSGASEREILVMAHQDQAPTTIEGADNDGSGVAILYHLAEIFAAEGPQPYSLTFAFVDAEEYGMIGSHRYVATHPDVSNIIAGITLDTLGRYYYDGMDVKLLGQYKSYGQIWLALAVKTAAEEAGLWEVELRAPFDQVTDQAAPASFTDQGPIIAMGIPGIGLAGRTPPEYKDEHYRLWHSPEDNMANQSAEVLGQSGLTVEALIRQLLSMEVFPQEEAPYMYFEGSNQILKGWPLWSIFIVFTGILFTGSALSGGTQLKGKFAGWAEAIPHVLGLWLPMLASILLLYLLVEFGLMEDFETYPATTKDPYLLNPRWPAILIYLAGLVIFFIVGRRLVHRWYREHPVPGFAHVKSLSLLVVALGAVYLLFRNPFSLFFFVPVLFWLAIGGRKGPAKAADLLFFLLGGLVIYVLIYTTGFVTLRYGFGFLWFLMNMFSIGMINFWTATLITGVIGAGLALVVNPPLQTQK